ncbi:MAG: elongation factor G [Phycisphaerae bacterium]|nr:elongation factor G [Phycisphaerae bacterium]
MWRSRVCLVWTLIGGPLESTAYAINNMGNLGGTMPNYTGNDIRNIALVGHSGSGKTSLCEAFLHVTGATNRLGSVADKTSHLDTDEEEKERECSIESHVLNVSHDGKTLNIIDTPGAPDFIGPAIASLAAVETAVLVVHATAGIQVNTRRMRDQAKNFGLAKVIVVNRIDADNANFEDLLNSLRESFGPEVTPVNLPAGGGKSVVDCVDNADGDADFADVADTHTNIVERVAEADDALMNKYFEEGALSAEEVRANLQRAITNGVIVPVLFTNARSEVGIKELLSFIAGSCPSPAEGKQRAVLVGEEEKPIDAEGPFCGQVFKVAVDPRSNIKYSFIRAFGGALQSDGNILLSGEKKGGRPGHLLKFQGSEHREVDEGIAGDIFAVAKLDLHIGNTVFGELTDRGAAIAMPRVPTPMFSLAIQPKARGDETKIGEAVKRFTDSDPCFKTFQDPQTNELVISGVGDMHLRAVLSKMLRQFKLEVTTKSPKIPYRETVSASADGHYRHKKQTGGAGQFGEVFLKVSPLERGSDPALEWSWDIFGGTIPSQYEPAVKKGVTELMSQGAVAGFPVQDVKVSIVDGKHHPVDSKEIAFKIAGKLAFKDAILKAKPILLEPIVNIEVTVPSENVGDITGDLAQRRGRPSGQDMLPGNLAMITAQVPLAKVSDYHSRLSSITGGKGSYAMEFSHYEQVPSNEVQAIIAEYAPKKVEEE